MIGNGKQAEDVKVYNLFTPERVGSSATIYYNGVSATTTAGTGIDGQGFEDLHLILSYGTIVGAVATLSCALLEAGQDNPMVAIPVTGASFTARTPNNDEAVIEASVDLKSRQRYLWLREDFQGTPVTGDFSAIGILSKAQSVPVSKTLDFEI